MRLNLGYFQGLRSYILNDYWFPKKLFFFYVFESLLFIRFVWSQLPMSKVSKGAYLYYGSKVFGYRELRLKLVPDCGAVHEDMLKMLLFKMLLFCSCTTITASHDLRCINLYDTRVRKAENCYLSYIGGGRDWETITSKIRTDPISLRLVSQIWVFLNMNNTEAKRSSL